MSDLLELNLDGLEQQLGCTITVFGDFPPFRVYHLDWADGSYCRIYRNGTWVHFDYLVSTNGGLLTQLVATLPAHFRQHNPPITHFSTPSGGADRTMRRVGFEDGQEHMTGYLMHPIHEGCRMDQYSAWRRGEQDEPDWHAGLASREDPDAG